MIITLNYFSGSLPISSFVCVMVFYLVPSFATYFSLVSFCLIFCVCGLCSAGYRIIVTLASCVCPLVGEFGSGVCVGFLVGGTGACPLVGGAGSCPSGG